ncbi:MAG: YfhO family protein [Oscillospiraceae bacterium]|nr:YfhO family protein [Oscillospiraceae bacterium]
MKLENIKDGFSDMLRFKNHKILSIVIVVLCSFVAALTAETLVSIVLGGRLAGVNFAYIIESYTLRSMYRSIFVFFPILFFIIHFIVNIRVFYNFLFKYRYAFAVILFLLLVIGRVHFSSVGMYAFHIQPGYGTELTMPIFGNPNAIRSDEWAVTTPIQLAAQHGPEPYGRYNFIARGAATENMPFGLTFNLATLAFPLSIFYLIGVEYGFSARWVGMLIMTFMVTFEFMYIISGKKRLFGLVGACLITFSPLFQWWSYIIFIPAGLGALVCFYYFLQADTKIKRLLLSLGITIFFSMFITNLYPAWQVPAGYLYFGLAVWIIVDNWDRVKKLGKLDWGILGLTVILIAATVGTYLHESREYIYGITNTIYPGTRHLSGGGIAFGDFANRMMNGGIFGAVSSERAFAHSNHSEFGGMFTLFPVPLLFAIFVMIKKKTIDLLSIILIAYTATLGTYVFLGWPDWLARVTLISFSATSRALDVLLFAQVLLFARGLSWLPEKSETSKKINVVAAICAVVISASLTGIAMFYGRTTFTYPIGTLYFGITFVGISLTLYSIFTFLHDKKVYMAACIYLILISGITWLNIHPVMIGLDAIYSKPLYTAVSELAVDKNERWISLDHVFYGPSFLIASGAPTINSTQFYPNLELWRTLDPEHRYEYIYNRYAHVSVELTMDNTSFVLWHADHMLLRLSYHDLATAGVRFIHATEPLNSNDIVSFELLYSEGGSRIYSVVN